MGTCASSIEDMILRSLREVAGTLDVQIEGPISSQTSLFGSSGVLTSMGLVCLIVDLEERIETEMGVSLVLADERAMSQTRSPFRTVSSLAGYIVTLVNQTDRDKTLTLC